MNWQPLEIAPKDGIRVLVDLSDGRQAVAWWELEFEPIVWERGEDPTYRSAWTDGTVGSWAREKMRAEPNSLHAPSTSSCYTLFQ